MVAGEASIWQPRKLLQLSADTKRIEERLTALAGQTLFTLKDFTYVLGTGSLEVHKNGLLLTKGVDWAENTISTFSLVVPATAGDQIVAVGYVAITGAVDVRDTDIFIANYQDVRDYAGTEISLWVQGQTTHADGGESFFQLVTGAAPGFYVDNDEIIIVPTGGDGSSAWIKSNPTDRLNPATMSDWQNDLSAKAGDVVTTVERVAGRAGGAPGKVISGIGTADGFGKVQHDTLSLTWVLRIRPTGKFNTREYGALGDDINDDKGALNACWVDAEAFGTGTGEGAQAYSPPGIYRCAELDLQEHVNLTDAGAISTKYKYNGAGGAGSTVFKATGMSSNSLVGLSILGGAGGSVFSDHLIRFASGGFIDNQSIWFDLQFAQCLFNAIEFDTGAFVINWHLDQIRWDAIGGYGIGMATVSGQEGRPFSLTNWTFDNTPPSGAPSPAPANWGLGVLRVKQGAHVTRALTLHVSTSRIEINTPLITTTYGDYTSTEITSLFYFEHASGAGEDYSIDADTIHVTDLEPGQALFHCDAARLNGAYSNITGVPADAFIYKEFTGTTRDYSIAGGVLTNQVVYPSTNVGQSLALIFKSDSQAFGASSRAIIEYNTISENTADEWNNSTFIYTASRSGMFNVTARVRIDSLAVNKTAQIFVEKNGATYATSIRTSDGTNIATPEVNCIVILEIGDTINVDLLQNDSVSRNLAGGNEYNMFSIFRIA